MNLASSLSRGLRGFALATNVPHTPCPATPTVPSLLDHTVYRLIAHGRVSHAMFFVSEGDKDEYEGRAGWTIL
jgi:hypothetical protein